MTSEELKLNKLRSDLSDIPTQTYITEKAKTVDVNNALALKANQSDLNATNANVATHTSQIASLASGSPKAVSLVSQMIDTTKNYVYTGSEGGYTAGNWYYWNGSAWTSGGIYQATGIGTNSITDDLLVSTGIKSDVNVNSSCLKIDLMGKLSVYVGTYMSYPELNCVSNASWKVTFLEEVNENDIVTFDGINNPIVSAVTLFDENYNAVSGYSNTVDGQIKFTVTIPANVKFVMFCYSNSDTPKIYKYVNQNNSVFSYENNLYTKTDLLSNLIFNTGYIDLNGAIVTTAWWKYTDYIDISIYEKRLLSNLSSSPIVKAISFYDKDKNSISYKKPFYAPIPLTGYVDIPDNCRYIRVSINSTNTSNLYAYKQNYTAITKWSNKVISLGGDSISSTDYTWYKDFLKVKTGASVVNNVGWSGRAVHDIAQSYYLSQLNNNNADLYIMLVGANDTGQAGSVGTFDANSPNALLGETIVTETDVSLDYNSDYYAQGLNTEFICAVSHIIRKLQGYFYNFRANAGLTGSETEAEKTAKLDAVKKPRLVFCTPFPEKRNDSNDVYSQPTNWLRKRNAVIECCEKYNVPCIDLYTLLKWKWELEPYWTSPTDTTNNKGIYTMDGLHPNKYGYDNMTDILVNNINDI